MRTAIRFMTFAVGLLALNVAIAQAPAGSTGLCKDGTYTTNATKSGACSGHKGVKEWYATAAKTDAKAAKADAKESKAEAKAAKADAKAANKSAASAPSAASTPSAASSPSPATASKPATTRAVTPASRATARSSATANVAPAPGGGPGMVWLNTSTNVYHCQGTKYYGTTKAGSYMTEAAAQAKGAHGERGKGCK